MVPAEEVVDWPELPHHMVELIMNKLMTPEISDYVRCGAVCTSWRTVFIDHHQHPPPRPRPVTLPPFLIVPTLSSTSWISKYSNTKSLSFYNVIDKKVYNQFQVTIPSNRYFRGASHGWLVAVDQNYNDCQVRLFNPFDCSSSSSRNASEILLPSLKDTGYVHHHKSPSSGVYLRKAVLSGDPSSNPIDYYIVMAILGLPGKLAYCRVGGGGCHDKAWTLVEFEYSNDWGFKDVIYCKGKFYALYGLGIVVVMDPTRNMMAITLEIPHPRPRSLVHAMYLVEVAGYLFLVSREIAVGVEVLLEDTVTRDRVSYSTTRFRVFMLKEKTKKGKIFDIEKMKYHNYQEQNEGEEGGMTYEWKLVDDLCGSTLFLGDNHSIWVRASDYPGYKPNSIYFTDNYTHMYPCEKWNGPYLGVFSLVDGTIENHYPTNHSTPMWRPVPIWIQPIVQVYQTKKKSRGVVLHGTSLSIRKMANVIQTILSVFFKQDSKGNCG